MIIKVFAETQKLPYLETKALVPPVLAKIAIHRIELKRKKMKDIVGQIKHYMKYIQYLTANKGRSHEENKGGECTTQIFGTFSTLNCFLGGIHYI